MPTRLALCLLLGLWPLRGDAVNVLVIGDSQVAQSLGVILHEELTTWQGVSAAVYGSCGSYPRWWLAGSYGYEPGSGKSADELLREWKIADFAEYNAWYSKVGGYGSSLSPRKMISTLCGYLQGYPDGSRVQKNGRNVARKTPFFPMLLKDMNIKKGSDIAIKPDIVVVQLGGNLMHRISTPEDRQAARSDILHMIDLMRQGSQDCIWIGPSDGNSIAKPPEAQARLYDFMEETLNDAGNYCRFIDSRSSRIPELVFPENCPRSDGKHWDSCAANRGKTRVWAKVILETVDEMIRMQGDRSRGI